MARALSESLPQIHDPCEITDSQLGRYVEIGTGSRLSNVAMGDYSYCDRFADIANAQVGKFANIASFVRIGATDHPLARASLHHFMYRSAAYWPQTPDDTAWFAQRRARGAVIGHDTWIGHNAQIKPEVTVGDGAVVASGAIVTADVAPYTIVAGIPARPIRTRQPKDIADRLIALAWWDWDHDLLGARLPEFRALTATAFLDKFEA